ncbi:type II toxin-antitoxin system RelE/ParE family toxin [Candidatus Gottesmanbacteria bacterium]|nr:type II toxin-antitoxin system RelE/ParE family toxin [Candidatus Gottesmanbacteria bacterium]
MYKHFFTKLSEKEFNRLTPSEAERVSERIKALTAFPFPQNLNIKKMSRLEDSYRLRIGKMRIIFEIDHQKKIIVVRKIGYRGNVYSDL